MLRARQPRLSLQSNSPGYTGPIVKSTAARCTNKNQEVQAMAWKTIWDYFDIFRAIKSFLEPFKAT